MQRNQEEPQCECWCHTAQWRIQALMCICPKLYKFRPWQHTFYTIMYFVLDKPFTLSQKMANVSLGLMAASVHCMRLWSYPRFWACRYVGGAVAILTWRVRPPIIFILKSWHQSYRAFTLISLCIAFSDAQTCWRWIWCRIFLSQACNSGAGLQGRTLLLEPACTL